MRQIIPVQRRNTVSGYLVRNQFVLQDSISNIVFLDDSALSKEKNGYGLFRIIVALSLSIARADDHMNHMGVSHGVSGTFNGSLSCEVLSSCLPICPTSPWPSPPANRIVFLYIVESHEGHKHTFKIEN